MCAASLKAAVSTVTRGLKPSSARPERLRMPPSRRARTGYPTCGDRPSSNDSQKIHSSITAGILPALGEQARVGQHVSHSREAEFANETAQPLLRVAQVRVVPKTRQPSRLDPRLLGVDLPGVQVENESL